MNQAKKPPANKPTPEEFSKLGAFKRLQVLKAFPDLLEEEEYKHFGEEQAFGAPVVRHNAYGPVTLDYTSQFREPEESAKPAKSQSSEKKFRELTKAYFEKLGYVYEKSDSYNAFSGRTNDFLGAFDAIAFAPKSGIVGVQLTSASNMSARRKKLRENKAVDTWRASGGKVCLIGWQKVGNRWVPKVEEVGG